MTKKQRCKSIINVKLETTSHSSTVLAETLLNFYFLSMINYNEVYNCFIIHSQPHDEIELQTDTNCNYKLTEKLVSEF